MVHPPSHQSDNLISIFTHFWSLLHTRQSHFHITFLDTDFQKIVIGPYINSNRMYSIEVDKQREMVHVFFRSKVHPVFIQLKAGISINYLKPRNYLGLRALFMIRAFFPPVKYMTVFGAHPVLYSFLNSARLQCKSWIRRASSIVWNKWLSVSRKRMCRLGQNNSHFRLLTHV